jgi:D-alanyl-D-alanine carboxypeptidase
VAHQSWGSGWPNCQGSKINSGFSVSGTRFPGGMRHELVDLTTMLVQECKNHGYRFGTDSDPSYGCWGYSCRCISGSSTPSNHSWGLAVDINAPANPYTSPLVTDMPSWMPDLWNEYGFRWGGDYSGSKDAMHYEFMGSVSDAANETAKAKANGLGGGTPDNGDEDDVKDEDITKIANAVWSQIIKEADNQPAWAVLVAAKDVLASTPAILAPQTAADAIAQTRNDAAAIKANLGA